MLRLKVVDENKREEKGWWNGVGRQCDARLGVKVSAGQGRKRVVGTASK